MEGSVSIDGKLLAANEARVSVFDRGFLYGDGAFEVMRTYSGRVFRESDHLERLRDSCERLLLPVKSGPAQWSETIARTIEASGLPECYVRFMITRGVAPMGLQLGEAQHPSELCFALPLRPYPEDLYTRGIAIGLCQAHRATDGTRAAGAKTSNYLASVMALHEVQQRGCHEAIFLGPSGEVVEGASSNIFILRDFEFFTPPVEAGILPGITRKVVIELAQLLNFKVNETQLWPGDVYKADEVFITSTVREIMPVVRVDDVTIPPGRRGMTTQMLINAFRAVAARPPERAAATD